MEGGSKAKILKNDQKKKNVKNDEEEETQQSLLNRIEAQRSNVNKGKKPTPPPPPPGNHHQQQPPTDKSKKKKRKRKESDDEEDETRAWVTPSGVLVEELVPGHPFGEMALPGKKITYHYDGKCEGSNGLFITSKGFRPFKFRLGSSEANVGWNEGLLGIRAGGKRRLTVWDPHCSYGFVYVINVLRIS